MQLIFKYWIFAKEIFDDRLYRRNCVRFQGNFHHTGWTIFGDDIISIVNLRIQDEDKFTAYWLQYLHEELLLKLQNG